MLIPQGVAEALNALPGHRLAQRYSLYDHIGGQFAEIQRLISPNSAGGVSAVGARVEQIAGQHLTQYNPDQQRHLQLVPIETNVREFGSYPGELRVATVVGWGWAEV